MGSELRVGSFSVRTMGVNGPDSVWMRAAELSEVGDFMVP